MELDLAYSAERGALTGNLLRHFFLGPAHVHAESSPDFARRPYHAPDDGYDFLELVGLVEKKVCAPVQTFFPDLRVRETRQHDDPGSGIQLLDLAHQVRATTRGQPDVENGHVGSQPFHQLHRRWRVVGLAHYLDAFEIVQHLRQSLTDD